MDIINFIENEGGEIKSAVNKNTDMLIVDNLELTTSKLEKAQKLGIIILTSAKFKNKYL